MPKYNLDKLVGEPLILTIDGAEYTIVDMPVRDMVRLTSIREKFATDAGEDVDVKGLLKAVLGPAGIPDEVVEDMSIRKALGAVVFILRHFTVLPPEVTNALGTGALDGLQLPGPSSSPLSSEQSGKPAPQPTS